MILYFRAPGVHCQMEIDRKRKLFSFLGEQTNYKATQLPWEMLWDKCIEHQQNEQPNLKCPRCKAIQKQQDGEAAKLSDKKFAELFGIQMKRYGYELHKWQH